MKIKIRFFVIVILLLACALSLAACQEDGTDDGTLGTPVNLQLNGSTLTWNAVSGADGYAVDVDGLIDVTDTNSYSMAELPTGIYIVKVKAVSGEGDTLKESTWSESKTFNYTATGGSNTVDESAAVTAVTGGTVEGLNVRYEVASEIVNVDFSGIITVSQGAKWDLYADAMGQIKIATKIAANLNNGANTYYIVVTSAAGTLERVFTLNVWKNYLVTISLYVNDVLYGTEQSLTHTILAADEFEDAIVTGYVFLGWNTAGHYVIGNHRFDATVSAKTYMVDNFTVNGGSLTNIDPVTVTYGESYNFPVPDKTGYTFEGWKYNGNLITDSNGDSLADWEYDITAPATITAEWTINKYMFSVINSNSSMGNIGGGTSGEYNYNTSITVHASPNAGYTFLGWFESSGQTPVSTNTTYQFNMPAKSLSLTAKWVEYILMRTAETEGGSVSGNSGKITAGTYVTITATTNAGYTFLGWFDGGNQTPTSMNLSYSFYMPKENKTYTAKWIICPVTIEQNITEAGTISIHEKTILGVDTIITATTNIGFTFLGWFDGDDEDPVSMNLSYTFPMPQTTKIYTAKWMVCPITLERNITAAGTVSGIERTILGAQTTITATTNMGYTWLGWYDSNGIKVSEGSSLIYILTIPSDNATYEARWGDYNITLIRMVNGAASAAAGTVNGAGKFVAGTNINITATTNTGYTWLGWYDSNGIKVNEGSSLSYTLTMPFDNVTYEARWGDYNITLIRMVNGAASTAAGTVNGAGKFVAGTNINIIATTNTGYTWLGWFDSNGIKVSEGGSLSYTLTMPSNNVTYEARWGDYNITLVRTVNGEASTAGGNVLGAGKFVAGEGREISAITNTGYTWLGWFDSNGTKVSEDGSLSYTLTMPSFNITYEARWGSYILTRIGTTGGTTSGSSGRFVAGTNCTVTATTTITGYYWIGWYKGETKVSASLNYTFSMPFEDVALTARWSPAGLSGMGTETEPYAILTETELTDFATLVNNGHKFAGIYFSLGNDIDLSNKQWTPIGISDTNYFAGTFDGMGHIISNFQITGYHQYAGLFGYINGTIIKNIGIENFVIDVSYTAVADSIISAGGLVGFTSNCNIMKCYAVGDITVSRKDSLFTGSVRAGGLVGSSLSNDNIANCYAVVNVTATISSAGASVYAGGLLGWASDYITNCYARGTVKAINSTGTTDVARSRVVVAGGLVGHGGSAKVMNCISIATATVQKGSSTSIVPYTGGLVGYISVSTTTNSYRYLGNGVGAECTYDQLHDEEFYLSTLGWDNEIWDFSDTNSNYPVLRVFSK